MSDERKEGVAEEVTNSQVDDAGALSADQSRIEEWSKAIENMPSEGEMADLREKVSKAEDTLAKATRAHQLAAVRRALLLGWTEVADEEGVSSKQLHVWRQALAPDEEDMSDVPRKVIPREKRRIELAEQRIERRKQEEKTLEDRAERFRGLLKEWGKQ